MANELVIHYPTGSTLYGLLFDSTGQIWNGSAFAAPGSAAWTDYDIAMTEVATATGIYRASMPAAAAGVYSFVVRKQAGGSPAVSDIAVGVGRIEWTGTAEIMPASTTNITAGTINSVLGSVGSIATGGITSGSFATDAITATAIAANAIGSSELAATAAAEIAAAVIAGGAGTYSYSNTVDDGSGNFLDGVFIQLSTNAGFTNIVNTTHTNSLGAFTVYSDIAGTHYLRLQRGDMTFTDQTVTLA